ncbi:MAG: hypothetical protein KAV87_20995 [Desulfobacteraceae bacterium]|nr:hypothetical protein [Desulfobacteraceae bacterium]
MNRNLFFSGVLFALLFVTAGANAFDKEGFEVLDIAVKELKQDSIGHTWFGIKATIQNNDEAGKISVDLQALDSDGFEIDSVLLQSVMFESNETKNITTKTQMKSEEFLNVSKWQVKKKKKYPIRN